MISRDLSARRSTAYMASRRSLFEPSSSHSSPLVIGMYDWLSVSMTNSSRALADSWNLHRSLFLLTLLISF